MPIASQMMESRFVSKAPIEMKIQAELDQLPVMRAMAETLGLLGDFNLDEVADIRLAIDEACSQLIRGAAEKAELASKFTVTESELTAAISTRVVDGYVLTQSGFGWHVLTTVADAVAVIESAGGVAGSDREITIELVKQRSGR